MSVKGKGTQVYIGDIGASELTQIACLRSLNRPTREASEIDDSCLEDDTKQWIGGMVDGGTLSGTLKYDPTQTATLDSYVGEDKHMEIVFSDGSTWAADGFFKSFGGEGIEMDGLVIDNFSFRISGDAVWTPAA